MNLYAMRYRISKLIFPEVHHELATEYAAHSKLGGEFCESQLKLRDLESANRIFADLLTSARAIAERKGENTAWERFSNRIASVGIGSVTAMVFKVLPSDLEDERDYGAGDCVPSPE